MPIPKPTAKETQKDFMMRCIPAIINEYGEEQAIAICYKEWRDKK